MRQSDKKFSSRTVNRPGGSRCRVQSLLLLLNGRVGGSCLFPAAFVLCVYLTTLAPTVTGEDSGELVTAAYHFGVCHPPGYPLWTMLCGLWINLVPFGCVAWRANLFSALAMAIAVAILSRTLMAMRFRPFASHTAAAACGLSSAIWSQSVIAEVYTLNLVLMALLIWCLWQWHQSPNDRWLVTASCVLGLGMANHHIIGLAALGLGCWVVLLDTSLLRRPRLAARCVLAFVIGLTPYLYLLWAAHRNAPVNWGETTTLAALWEHVSRGQYKSDSPIEVQVPLTGGAFAGRLYYGLRWEVKQFTPILIPVLIAGVIWLARRRGYRDLLTLVFLSAFTCGPLFHYLGGPQLDRQDEFVNKVFLTPLALISAIPLAAGLQWGAAALWMVIKSRHPRGRGIARWIMATATLLLLSAAHWRENNMRHYWYAHDHARNMLTCMQTGAMIFPSGDHNTFPLIYLIHVEGIRPDVLVADKYGYIEPLLYRDMPNNPGKPRSPEDRDAIESWLVQNVRRPVYYTIMKTPPVDGFDVVPIGLLYHFKPRRLSVDTESCWSRIRYRNLDGTRPLLDHAAVNILADYHYACGIRALAQDDWPKARRSFDAALEVAWGLKEIINNIGSALADHGHVDEAIIHYEAAARLDWRYAPARWNLARIFQSQGRIDWAAKVYQDLVQAVPGDFRPYGELGFIYADAFQDTARARHWWYESLRRNPIQQQLIDTLAACERSSSADHAADSPLPASPAALLIEPATVELGVMGDSSERWAEVLIRNAGPHTIEVGSVVTSCACVVHELSPMTLHPGQSERRRLGLRNVGKSGPVNESLQLLDAAGQPQATVSIRAEARPMVLIEPESLILKPGPDGGACKAVLVVAHRDGEPFRITDVESSLPHILAKWDVNQAAARHEIDIEVDDADFIAAAGRLAIQTTLIEMPGLDVQIRVEPQAPATITPGVVFLGLMLPDQVLARDIRIRSNSEGQAIEPAFSTDDLPPGLEVELERASPDGAAWNARIKVDPSKTPKGTFQHELLIRYTNTSVLQKVHIYGMVGN